MPQNTNKSTKNSPQIPPVFGQNIICGKRSTSCILGSKERRNRRTEKAEKGPSSVKMEIMATKARFSRAVSEQRPDLRVLQLSLSAVGICGTTVSEQRPDL